MSMKVGIAGAGLIGRLFALHCLQRGWNVTLFDQDQRQGQKSCGFVAAGMIAPYTELEAGDKLLFQLGLESIRLWPNILQGLIKPVPCHFSGTLIVSHPQDGAELSRFRSILQHKLNAYTGKNYHEMAETSLVREKMEALVPGISPNIEEGDFIPEEGMMDSAAFFCSTTAFFHHQNIKWFENTTVSSIKPYEITVDHNKFHFDLVCDTRGLGAKANWQELRGIRGELVWLHAPQVTWNCSVRLLHPRYPIYISPRNNNIYVVGATSIESEDISPISVESTLELLSSAYIIHPGFAQARLVKTLTQARPSFSDQLPKISYSPGLLKINGLYRHGYMVGPAVIQDAMHLLEKGRNSVKF